MEILSYVLEGGLRHRDSTGGSSVLRPGELQLMSAGRGISHSEMNDSQSAPVHFLQIWLTPERRDTAPNYQQHTLDPAALRAGFVCVAAPASETAPFKILADARLFIAWPSADQTLTQALAPTRHYYLQLARGSVTLGENLMTAGDAAMIEAESALHLTASSDAELLLFDLAPSE
jgi:quercetin 2,3-dioxygenase